MVFAKEVRELSLHISAKSAVIANRSGRGTSISDAFVREGVSVNSVDTADDVGVPITAGARRRT